MATPTLPTVPLPTETDDDTDDDDDILTSVLSGQPIATTAPGQPPAVVSAPPPAGTGIPGQPPTNTLPPGQSPPGTVGAGQTPTGAPINTASAAPSRSHTRLADSLPSGNATNPANAPAGDNRGLSVGATAGIGVGVALAVILMVLGAWFFVRRRRRRSHRTRTVSGDSTIHGDTPDEEVARKLSGQDIRAYRAPGGMAAVEMGYGKELGVDGKHRAELASPIVPVEAVGDRGFAVELAGSEVPMRQVEKGDGERLFSDPPIDDRYDTHDTESRLVDVKR